MRILYITTVGSTMGFFRDLITELVCDGSTVDIATNECHRESMVNPLYQSLGCRVYPISCSRFPFDKGNLNAINEIREIVAKGNYDIVHCHTPIAAACTRLACKGLRKSGVKVIYTAHGFHFYTGAPLKNWLLYYPVEWLCAHWTDVLITINKEDYERAKKHMHARRVVYVPGVGIDTKRFMDATVDRATMRREIGVPEDAVLLMSVGELIARKNHEVAMKALAKIADKNIHYAIVGIGPLRDELQTLAESLGVGEQVHFLGYRRDIPELYKAADICVFPSHQEGLPVAVMEAMACGLPIIASDIRGSHELLSSSGNVLITKCDDAGAFAEAIKRLSADATLCAEMGVANLEKSAAYDVEIINVRMKEIYNEQFE